MKILISAPISGHKQYSINRWLQWVSDQTHKDYDFAFCVNGKKQAKLVSMLKQVEIRDTHGQTKKPILLWNTIKDGVQTTPMFNITHARESLRQYAIKKGYDKIFFLDTDTIPMFKDAIPILEKTGKDAVSGVYMYKNTAVPVCVSKKRETNPTLEDIRDAHAKGKLIECIMFGLGCALIDRTVFEQIPFDFKYFGKEIGEDYGYCWAMDKRNIKRWIEPRLICLHLSKDKDNPELQSFLTVED